MNLADRIKAMTHKGDRARARIRAAALQRQRPSQTMMLGHLVRIGGLIQGT